MDNRNNNGDNRVVDRDVTSRNADGQPPVDPASSTTARSSSGIEAYRKAFSRNRWHGYRDEYKWLNDPDSYPDSDPIHDPDFHAAHPGWLAGYKDAAAAITENPQYKEGFVRGYNDFRHGDNTNAYYRQGYRDGARQRQADGEKVSRAVERGLTFLGWTPSEILGKNMESANYPKPNDGQDYQPHHIVPRGSKRARLVEARAKLEKWGIDINQAENGWWAPGNANQRLNNLKYDREISKEIMACKSKKQALKVLAKFRERLTQDWEQFVGK